MFKFPLSFLKRESEIPVDYDKLMKWLEEQGFEIASLVELPDDKLIEIEVKANRPDMLYVLGVLREYYSACCIPTPKSCKADMGFVYDSAVQPFGHKIRILSPDVHRYYAVAIEGINNTAQTPVEIADVLNKLGIGLINPAVDISNYVTNLIGQPTHIFDADKICGDIVIENLKVPLNFLTLNGTETVFPEGSLFIRDDEAALCAAGIIGGKKAESDADTTNVIIEAANFDHIVERVTSKKTHISTAASYRYERGVSVDSAIDGLNIVAKLISEVCGGKVCATAFEYTDGKQDAHTMLLSSKKTNALLGSMLSPEEIKTMLERCFFRATVLDSNSISVDVPSFRLDIDDQVDLIEEVGRIYGYHNIMPQPVKLDTEYVANPYQVLTRKIRSILAGFRGIECLTYGFIPANSMELLSISPVSKRFYGDIQIINPLSKAYSLMRPTMAYSLISTASDNLKAGRKSINLFECGKTYFRDPGFEYGYNQRFTLAGVLYGINQSKGFGINKDNPYVIYDVVSLVSSLMGEFNMEYTVQKTDELQFLAKGSAGYIILDSRIIGCIGIVDKPILKSFGVENLAFSDMLYYELDYGEFVEMKKQIKHNHIFPSVKREYNFIVANGIYFADYKLSIQDVSDRIVGIRPLDVYTGKGILPGTTSVLLEIEYNDASKVITLEEVEEIENQVFFVLNEKYGITLKQQ